MKGPDSCPGLCFGVFKFQFIGLFDNSQCKIQNAKCRMIVSPAATIAIICAANTTILHLAFYILHSGNRPDKSQFIFQKYLTEGKKWCTMWIVSLG
jgi:hypothetical protein